MKDDETCFELYIKLNDVVNSCFNLGGKILDSKVVEKILRFFPKRLRSKVTIIEENKNMDLMRKINL